MQQQVQQCFVDSYALRASPLPECGYVTHRDAPPLWSRSSEQVERASYCWTVGYS